jgi:hypothetical protein
MPKVMCLYLDDSGTRNPDQRVPNGFLYGDWFTLGGFLVKEEHEGSLREAHATFCEKWKITYPLHSYDIRQSLNRFKWLLSLDHAEYNGSCANLLQCS